MFIFHAVSNFLKSSHHNRWLMLGILLLAAHMVVVVGTNFNFFNVVLAPNYLKAVLFSFLIALIMAIWIHEITDRLYRKYSKQHERHKRLVLQCFWGLLIPLIVDYGLIAIYFELDGQSSILENSFAGVDMALIMSFLFVINGYYSMQHINKKEQQEALYQLQLLNSYHRKKIMREAPVSISEVNLTMLSINFKEIACVCKQGNLLIIHYLNGENEVVQKKIEVVLEGLAADDYFLINRYCIMHRLLIFKVEDISSRRYRLILRHPFNHLKDARRTEVSQSVQKEFKRWYQA